MNTPTEPPDSPSKPRRHLALVPPLQNQSNMPAQPDRTPKYQMSPLVKFLALTFAAAVVENLAAITIQAFYSRHTEEQKSHKTIEVINDAQNGTRRQVVQTSTIYPDEHLETVAGNDALAEMYPDPKDLCIARIISITKGIQAETGGVLPPDLLVVANANGVRCEHDEKKGKYSLKFTP